MRKFLAWFALALGLFAFAAHFITPWPSVWVIRAVFDSGAAAASEKLEKHLPDNVSVRSALHYDPNDPDAFLDIYSASGNSETAAVVVWIHGGGFVSGQRSDIANYLKILAGRGFVVVNVDYTVAPTAVHPTPTRQLAKALAYLESNAAKLGIEGRGYVLAGDSAGSQIAAQLANVVNSPAYATRLGVSSPITPDKLKGALLHCGVYDVSAMNTGGGGVLGWFTRTVTWAYSGKPDWREVKGFETFSVPNYITPQFPPTFISVGNADPLAPQTILMERKLREKGAKVDSLFFAKDYRPPLSHEYQFDLDTNAGKEAMDRTVLWLNQLG
jgi:acetyl esterase